MRSIISLAARHWREHWLREVLCLLAVAAVTALLYAGNLSNSGSVSVAGVARQLGKIRYDIVLLWIAVTAVYTLVTAFRGYGDARRCYATLLLPDEVCVGVAAHDDHVPAGGAGCNMVCRCGGRQVDDTRAPHVGGGGGECVDAVGCRDGRGRAAELYTLQYISCRVVQRCGDVSAVGPSACRGGGDGGGRTGCGACLPVGSEMCIRDRRTALYPFVWVEMERGYAVTWSMPVSWCSRMAGYAISYVWYAALPVAVYVLSYLKFKEREI